MGFFCICCFCTFVVSRVCNIPFGCVDDVIWKWSSSMLCTRLIGGWSSSSAHARCAVAQGIKMSCASVFFVVMICSLHFRLLLSGSVSDEPSTPSPGSHKCPPANGRSETCVCQHDKGIIDVTPLANNDGTAKYAVAKCD